MRVAVQPAATGIARDSAVVRDRNAMKAKTMRRLYLREAAVMLVAGAAGGALCSPGAPVRLGRPAAAPHPPFRRRRSALGRAGRSRRSARAANALCLPRALAAHAMLRRRGIASTLCLGVARDGDKLRRPCLGRGRQGQDRRRARSRRLSRGLPPTAVARHERHRRIAALRRRAGRAPRARTRGQCARAIRSRPRRHLCRRRHRPRACADAHDAGGSLRPPAGAGRQRRG